MSDFDEQIKENALAPKRAKNDMGEVEQHSLKDQIALSNHLDKKANAKKKNSGIRIQKIVPPGTV